MNPALRRIFSRLKVSLCLESRSRASALRQALQKVGVEQLNVSIYGSEEFALLPADIFFFDYHYPSHALVARKIQAFRRRAPYATKPIIIFDDTQDLSTIERANRDELFADMLLNEPMALNNIINILERAVVMQAQLKAALAKQAADEPTLLRQAHRLDQCFSDPLVLNYVLERCYKKGMMAAFNNLFSTHNKAIISPQNLMRFCKQAPPATRIVILELLLKMGHYAHLANQRLAMAHECMGTLDKAYLHYQRAFDKHPSKLTLFYKYLHTSLSHHAYEAFVQAIIKKYTYSDDQKGLFRLLMQISDVLASHYCDINTRDWQRYGSWLVKKLRTKIPVSLRDEMLGMCDLLYVRHLLLHKKHFKAGVILAKVVNRFFAKGKCSNYDLRHFCLSLLIQVGNLALYQQLISAERTRLQWEGSRLYHAQKDTVLGLERLYQRLGESADPALMQQALRRYPSALDVLALAMRLNSGHPDPALTACLGKSRLLKGLDWYQGFGVCYEQIEAIRVAGRSPQVALA